MNNTEESAGFLQTVGESIGGLIAGIPSALGSFFSGVGEGAGVNGLLDWILLLLGLALLLSVIKGIKAGRIVGPALRGVIGVALMGWAVT
ncbi:MAG: hypothetical protein AAF671_07665 [Pseudomonadota bacterium]